MNTPVRWNPFHELAATYSAFDRFVDSGWPGITPSTGTDLALDVHESGEAYTVIAAVPGLDAEAIDIRLQEQQLTISAEWPQTVTPESATPLLRERPAGHFLRRITLPQAVGSAGAEAICHDGLLRIRLPKTGRTSGHVIPVRARG